VKKVEEEEYKELMATLKAPLKLETSRKAISKNILPYNLQH